MKQKAYQFWFATGSQDLYGEACLRDVAEHAGIITERLNASGILPYEVVLKPVLIDNASIRSLFRQANDDENCAGVITWMHTFSPAKSWILGLQEYRKPLLHLHTQFNQEIPYDSIDMDFMNENQSAHGDREFGHMVTRMGLVRKVIAGFWDDDSVKRRIASWMRTAVGIVESSHIRVVRFADNMRNVAVTEGDKVEAQVKFGWEIDAYPVNEAAEYVQDVKAGDVSALVEEYYDRYDILLDGRDPEEFKKHVAVQAQIELGFEAFLREKDYQAIVTHFGDLGSLKQLPGLAIQRLMEKGYGFGGEGDWKTAAMVRLMKLMTESKKDAKGTSFMEDYTYNLVPGKEGILQAHMLEVCPSIAEGRSAIKVNPLSMGDREDPARLVFTAKEGRGVAASLIDLGTRFRLIINTVHCKKIDRPMPKLPVATAFWTPEPNLVTGAECWILAGGAHHTAFSYDLTAEQLGDWAEAMGIEAVYIDENTNIRDFKNELRWNSAVYR
ncbi:L-arabinose isomerase [Clostridium boliviensis]|uniref:L-arabinose isomerase n=1 Tax=Clostridium boliviensis TaxID=318465 RepID=A0ABU4GKR9_9CLOT|nr:L-arabinose isomerase [Clostridium boliviensis]MDW2798205.1 L-arabinose isomerase [Clostridium boliviensis]